MIFFFLPSVFLYLYFKSLKKVMKIDFKIYPLVGILPELINNRHRFLDWNTEILTYCPSNTVLYPLFGKVQEVITANPSNVEHMLKTNFDNYQKGYRFTSPFVDFFGQGLFNSDGEIWKVHWKAATYLLNTKSFRNFVTKNVIVEIETRLIPVLERASKSGRILD